MGFSAAVTVLAGLSLAVWIYLILFRGGFWRADARLEAAPPTSSPVPLEWPDVAALVPARNEAPVIAAAVASLLAQDYPGELRVIVIDDGSDDGTAAEAESSARRHLASVIHKSPESVQVPHALDNRWMGVQNPFR